MKFNSWYAVVLAVVPTASSAATAGGLSFTYQTLTGGSIETATTVLPPTAQSTSIASSKPGPSVRPVTQISDGQVQASSAAPVPVVQISDGQLQVPAPKTSTLAVSQISDGQIQVSASAISPPPSSSAKTSTPTSYKLNPSDLAYPNFTSITGPLELDSPGANLPNASTLANDAITIFLAGKNTSNCNLCQTILTSVAARMRVQQDTLEDIATAFCSPLSIAIPTPVCVGLLKIASKDIGGIFPAMDMMGQDGQLLCAFMFGICTLPAPPTLDLQTLFKNKTQKPEPRILKPMTKEPLKVLHISDYHLDLRYVVGSEANCTGLEPVCCRVFPYTNISAPISQPASLFGNYLCDTPEALATSVFRAVPKVTGYEWDDFSFGIFTGDLVSHDLWELTEEYVLAEELTSYQHFFNGMGGVKMFPTLGYVILRLWWFTTDVIAEIMILSLMRLPRSPT